MTSIGTPNDNTKRIKVTTKYPSVGYRIKYGENGEEIPEIKHNFREQYKKFWDSYDEMLLNQISDFRSRTM